MIGQDQTSILGLRVQVRGIRKGVLNMDFPEPSRILCGRREVP